MSVCILTIKISQWARENSCNYRKKTYIYRAVRGSVNISYHCAGKSWERTLNLNFYCVHKERIYFRGHNKKHEAQYKALLWSLLTIDELQYISVKEIYFDPFSTLQSLLGVRDQRDRYNWDEIENLVNLIPTDFPFFFLSIFDFHWYGLAMVWS